MRADVAVGTRFSSRPPHRTVRAAFPHTACMGVSLSRVHHAIFVVLCCFILLFDPCREHSSIPTAHCRRRRAQRRSRTALLQRRRRLVLDGREHDGRLPVIGWSAAMIRGEPAIGREQSREPRLYGSFFVKGASRHFCRALLLHSFVRPVPRAFFHPDRTLPSPSRAAAVKDGASS